MKIQFALLPAFIVKFLICNTRGENDQKVIQLMKEKYNCSPDK